MSKRLDVYISLISPYSYVANSQLASLVKRTQSSIYYHILDLRQLIEITGNVSPITSPVKRKYLAKDLQDWCRYYHIPFKVPSRFPANSRPSAASAIIAQKEGKLPQFVDIVLQAYFVEDQDIANPQILGNLASKIGLNAEAVTTAAKDPAMLGQVDAETEVAASRGVFGVPTFFVGDDMYWGSDRLMFVEQALKKGVGSRE